MKRAKKCIECGCDITNLKRTGEYLFMPTRCCECIDKFIEKHNEQYYNQGR